MNRQQRRAAAAPDRAAVAELEPTRQAEEARLLEQARELGAWLTNDAPEPIAERVRQLDEMLAGIATDRATQLVAGPALLELRRVRADLAARSEMVH